MIKPYRIEYKGFKYCYKVKGGTCRCRITRTKINLKSYDSKFTQFNDNAGININKKVNIMSKYINGPVSRSIRRKKLVTLFKKVV